MLDLRGGSTGGTTFGGIDAHRLAEIYGTPLGIIDLGLVDDAIAQMKAACAPHGVRVSYAGKAFLAIEFTKFLKPHDVNLDVCSLGELTVAERAGFPAERMTLHGAGKTLDELRAALDGRVGRIVVDGLDELRTLSRLASRNPCNVLLRLNTGIEAHAHAYVQTAGNRTKFGIVREEEHEAAALLSASPMLKLRGLHAHIGSQIYESAPFVANGEALVDAAARFRDLGLRIDTLIVGGGFGIPEKPEEEALDLRSVIREIVEAVNRRAASYALETPAIEIEPGRAIVGEAGTTLYRVMAVKRRNDCVFVIVDGGMGDNPRPALYDAYHHIVSVDKPDAAEVEATVAGRTCENDELGMVRLPEDVAAGQLLAMQNTGAYTHSMASNYNRFPRPAVVAVHNGTHRLLLRRETLDDVLHADVLSDI